MDEIERSKQMKKNYIWNTLGSMSFASINFVFTMLITYNIGIDASGKFSLAFSTAQIFYTVGLFGVNAIQMTDSRKEFNFFSYLCVKIVTTCFMLFLSVIYIAIGDLTSEKNWLIVLFTIYLAIFSFAEVFQAQLFVKGRIDSSGKSLFLRTIISIITFGIGIVLKKNIIYAISSTIIVDILSLVLIPVRYLRPYEQKRDKEFKNIFLLLKIACPLCVSNFLFTFLNNVAKYAIDFYFDDYVQGIYNMLYIPVMVIVLVCGFIYRPLLGNINEYMEKEKYDDMKRIVKKIFSIIAVLGIVGIAAVTMVGPYVFSKVFSVDFEGYIVEMCLMVVASVMVAISNFLYYVLVALKANKTVFFAAVLGAIFGSVFCYAFMEQLEIKGAFCSLIIGYGVINIILWITGSKNIRKKEG